MINPNSDFYLAINTGFPNTFDKANNRNGTFLMIHGDCASSGCYAMTDEQIGEIYSLARDSLVGGPSFQVQAYPFRMTPANLARHRTNPHTAFWKMLKIGNDYFEGMQQRGVRDEGVECHGDNKAHAALRPSPLQNRSPASRARTNRPEHSG